MTRTPTKTRKSKKSKTPVAISLPEVSMDRIVKHMMSPDKLRARTKFEPPTPPEEDLILTVLLI